MVALVRAFVTPWAGEQICGRLTAACGNILHYLGSIMSDRLPLERRRKPKPNAKVKICQDTRMKTFPSERLPECCKRHCCNSMHKRDNQKKHPSVFVRWNVWNHKLYQNVMQNIAKRCISPLAPSDGLRHEFLEPRPILLPSLALQILQTLIIWRLDCLRKCTSETAAERVAGTTRYTTAITHYTVLICSMNFAPADTSSVNQPSDNLHLQGQHCNETGCRPTWWDAPGTWAMTRLWRTCCPCL